MNRRNQTLFLSWPDLHNSELVSMSFITSSHIHKSGLTKVTRECFTVPINLLFDTAYSIRLENQLFAVTILQGGSDRSIAGSVDKFINTGMVKVFMTTPGYCCRHLRLHCSLAHY